MISSASLDRLKISHKAKLKHTMTKNIIGMKYIPQDNSYARNLSSEHSRSTMLAGCPTLEAQVTTLQSNPFKVKTMFLDTEYEYEFVLVLSESGETYFYMWHERGLVSETNTTDMILSKMAYASGRYQGEF